MKGKYEDLLQMITFCSIFLSPFITLTPDLGSRIIFIFYVEQQNLYRTDRL